MSCVAPARYCHPGICPLLRRPWRSLDTVIQTYARSCAVHGARSILSSRHMPALAPSMALARYCHPDICPLLRRPWRSLDTVIQTYARSCAVRGARSILSSRHMPALALSMALARYCHPDICPLLRRPWRPLDTVVQT